MEEGVNVVGGEIVEEGVVRMGCALRFVSSCIIGGRVLRCAGCGGGEEDMGGEADGDGWKEGGEGGEEGGGGVRCLRRDV